MLNHKKSLLIIICVVFFIVIVIPFYGYEFKDTSDINAQGAHLLSKKSSKSLLQVSYNMTTYYFLKKTKAKKISDLSDAQGTIGNESHYVGTIDHKLVSINVSRDNTSNLLRRYIPKYKIMTIQINPY